MTLRRRTFLAAAGATWLAPRPAQAAADFELRDLALPGTRRVGRRMTLLVPKHTTGPVPLLVLLHGLGETHDEKLGARAWVDRYGLARAYRRLLAPPLKPLKKLGRHWTKKGLAHANADLRAKPFGGMAIACPYTPNVYKAPSRKALLDDYADWIAREVVPRAGRETPLKSGRAATHLDGCSLGGYVGIEVFLRKPALFGVWGSVQGALGKHRVARYAERLADVVKTHGPTPIHLETSGGDAFRSHNQMLAKALFKRSVPHTFTMPPGPHNQPFLRDSGTPLMLLFHDRN